MLSGISRLNPYSTGTPNLTAQIDNNLKQQLGLNPYSTGTPNLTYYAYDNHFQRVRS